ncbi:hypothetical protein OG943_43450 [Amycolatopsis sp. NBC_00345]
MATTESAEPLALSDTVCGVLTSRQLRSVGVSARRAARLSGPGGPWRRLYPGVFLLHDTPPTRRQLLHAAISRHGHEAVITGADALRAHGVHRPLTDQIHLLIPHYRRLAPDAGMLTCRTARMPEPVMIDGLPFAPVARAALDLARREPDVSAVEQLVTLPLHWGLADRAELLAELDAGNQRGSATVRTILRGLDERDTFAHGLAAKVLRSTPLPAPMWNVAVCDRRGRRIGTADAWWDEVGLAWRYLTGVGVGDFTHLALTATGTVLARCTTQQLIDHPAEVGRELIRAYTQAARTPRPKVRAVHHVGTAA